MMMAVAGWWLISHNILKNDRGYIISKIIRFRGQKERICM